MAKKKLILWSLVNSLGAAVYIFLVSLLLHFGEQIFGKMKDIIGPVAFLLLFVFSAAVMASLILGKPILLYLEGKKKESLILFFYTLTWLFIFLLITLIINVLK